METSDSTPGSLAALPTQPRNPATLSSPWSPPVLISSFPPCFPNYTGILLANSNNNKKFFSKSPNILVCEAKSHSVSVHTPEDLQPQEISWEIFVAKPQEKLRCSSGQCRVPFHHTTFSKGCREKKRIFKKSTRAKPQTGLLSLSCLSLCS